MRKLERPSIDYPMERHGAVYVPPSRVVPHYLMDKKPDRTDTNHHLAFPRKTMARLAITQCFRDLQANQEVMPRQAHNWLHANYEPSRMPNLTAIMERLDQAHDSGESLRLGTAHEFRLVRFGAEAWQQCENEYNQIHLIDRIEYA